ncbi:hypothetical protein Tco_0478133 [Tanacetum coccineum]
MVKLSVDLNGPKDSSKTDKATQNDKNIGIPADVKECEKRWENVSSKSSSIGKVMKKLSKEQPASSMARPIVVESAIDPFDGLDEILGDYANTRKQITRDESTWKQMVVHITTARRVSTVRRIKTRERINMKIVYQDYLRDKLRIEKDFQVQDYALWDVIENGNSFKPAPQTTTNDDGSSTLLIPSPVTTKENYKDAQTLFAAIQTRFGGNEATKKTQKTLLKQMYENVSALSTESLDSIFNRLQKIVSQLAILGENISQEDLNLKFLRSLASEWNTHVVVWRNKPDLDIMSFDDLYNNFKIVKQEVKGTASSSSSYQNMAFVPASTQVSTASIQVSTANLSDDTVYAFLASQPNGSQLVYENLEKIHEDDIEEMDLK